MARQSLSAVLLSAVLLSLFLACTAVVLCVPGRAVAQSESDRSKVDQSELKGRIERIQRLSKEEKVRLKEALRRFRALPPAERRALRAKAKRVGVDRLASLGGRDLRPLREKHERMRKERAAILEAIRFDARTGDLSERERRMLSRHAGRQFHHFVKRRILSPDHSPLPADFDGWAPEDRRKRIRAAHQALMKRLLSDLSPEERARHDTGDRETKRQIRADLMMQFRSRMVLEFARNFDAGYLQRYLQTSPAERQRHLENMHRRSRWFEVMRMFERQVGVSRKTLRLLRSLHADDLARLRARYEGYPNQPGLKDLPELERRQRVEEAIRTLYGKSASDDRRPTPHSWRTRRSKRQERTVPAGE